MSSKHKQILKTVLKVVPNLENIAYESSKSIECTYYRLTNFVNPLAPVSKLLFPNDGQASFNEE